MRKIIIFGILILIIFSTGCETSINKSDVIQENSSILKEETQGTHLGDCLFGKSECEFPGNCDRYIDQDKDGNCDHTI